MMALLPAGASAQSAASDASARTIDPPCSGNADRDFDDIAGSAHEEAVRCMAEEGLTEGTSASGGASYAPRNVVTRAQMASFIARFIEAQGYELTSGDPDRFDDVPADFAHADNINRLAEIGVVQGTGASEGASYAPQAGVTRAQMASYLRRSLSFIENGAVEPLSVPPAGAEDAFADDDGSVHEDNINAIASVGIVQGFDDGTYRPGDNVFRDTMASFVMRSFNYAIVEDLRPETATFEGVELSWFDEVSTEVGEPFGADDVFATGDAGEPGHNGAEGTADIMVDTADNSVTFEVEYGEVAGPFGDGPGLHIHEGARDENGPVVAFLATGDELDDHAGDGVLSGTVTVDRSDLNVGDIVRDPEGFYVNLHSDDFPAGAIRGQLPDGPPSIAEEDITSTWTVEADPVQAQLANPDAGEPGASATFELTFDSVNNVVCYEITSDGVSGDYQSAAHTSTHIHQGDVGQVGPPRVIFRNPTPVDDGDPDGVRTASGCHSVPQATNTGDPDNGVGFDLAEIEDNPSEFYVDIHTEDFVPGAVRGQLAGAPEVVTEVQLNYQSEVADEDDDLFTGPRGQDSFDAAGVDAEVFHADVEDVAAATHPDDGSGSVLLAWSTDEDHGPYLHAAGSFLVTSPLADGFFDGNPIHLHEGAVDVNGGVLVPFATPEDVEVLDDLGDDRELLEYTMRQTVTDAPDLASVLEDLGDAMDGADDGDVLEFYLNMHTEDNVPGEIRGHVQALDLTVAGLEHGMDVDGGLSMLPPVFKLVEAEDGDDTITLVFDVDLADVADLDEDGFVVEIDGAEADVDGAAIVGGTVELTLDDDSPDDGDMVEVTILDDAAEDLAADTADRTGTAATSVRVRAAATAESSGH